MEKLFNYCLSKYFGLILHKIQRSKDIKKNKTYLYVLLNMLLTMETEIKHDFNFSQQVTGDETAAGGSICFVRNCGLEVKIKLGRSQSNCNYVVKYNKDNIRKK